MLHLFSNKYKSLRKIVKDSEQIFEALGRGIFFLEFNLEDIDGYTFRIPSNFWVENGKERATSLRYPDKTGKRKFEIPMSEILAVLAKDICRVQTAIINHDLAELIHFQTIEFKFWELDAHHLDEENWKKAAKLFAAFTEALFLNADKSIKPKISDEQFKIAHQYLIRDTGSKPGQKPYVTNDEFWVDLIKLIYIDKANSKRESVIAGMFRKYEGIEYQKSEKKTGLIDEGFVTTRVDKVWDNDWITDEGNSKKSN